jgi:hypothetical protein
MNRKLTIRLFTIGYQGLSLEAFLGILRSERIDLLVDVRELPLSRKEGFSKAPLKAALEADGISYSHFRELGAPEPLRRELRAGGSWEAFEAGYRTHLENHREALRKLAFLLRERRVCLLCFEEDPLICHRSLIAQALLTDGLVDEVEDLRKGKFLDLRSGILRRMNPGASLQNAECVQEIPLALRFVDSGPSDKAPPFQWEDTRTPPRPPKADATNQDAL